MDRWMNERMAGQMDKWTILEIFSNFRSNNKES